MWLQVLFLFMKGVLTGHRSEFDVQGRELLARESDFGFEVPLDMANDTTVMAPELQESPVRQPPELFEPMLDPQSDDDGGNDYGNDYGDDFGGNDDDGLEDIPEAESSAEEARVDQTGVEEPGVGETTVTQSAANRTTAKKRTIKMSRHGIEYPSLPPAVVKRLAQTFAKTSGAKGKITPDALKAVMQASDWFFQQTSETLERYANHAHRKTIDESDMLTLLKKYDPHSCLYGYLGCIGCTSTDTLQTTSSQLPRNAVRSGAASSSAGIAPRAPHDSTSCAKETAKNNPRRSG